MRRKALRAKALRRPMGFSRVFFANGCPSRRRSHVPSVSPTNNLPLMTRAGLEPATYGLKVKILINVLASLSIRKLRREMRFRQAAASDRIVENRQGSASLGRFWGVS